MHQKLLRQSVPPTNILSDELVAQRNQDILKKSSFKVKSTRVQANLIDELTAQTRKILESLDGAPSLSELARLWNERRKPFWRITPGLYRKFCAVVLNRGENLFAIEIADEGLRCAPNEYALEYFRALALARVGNFGAAERILAERPSLMAEVSDAPSLVGRVYKDYWKQTGDKSFLRVALDAYRQAYEKGEFFYS